ncbi:TPA: hypothetical protein R6D22_000967 [Campylobacter coli]|nr:hypothetical protein [Campylobacter coli]MCE7263109.1 hypothetical protein [Campylobacter coli]HED8320155.1 hypothetical protein [Campylobacter coli]HED8341715.1 hypothetical protein [Campylobacter coli]HED8589016.1 hypothetical protein [Campylobacter coli]
MLELIFNTGRNIGSKLNLKGVKMEIILGIGAVTLVIVSIALVYTFYKEKHKTQH